MTVPKYPFCLLESFIICMLMIPTFEGVTVEEDLKLSIYQKVTLDKFRSEVLHMLSESYMQYDIYLIRWLRGKLLNTNSTTNKYNMVHIVKNVSGTDLIAAANFNIPDAKAALIKNLDWRIRNNMSTIHLEDFSDMTEEYPYNIDTSDKLGRPIVSLRFGEWDIRRAVVTSRGPRLTRYLYKALDQVTTKIRDLQSQGKLVTQWISLLDMDGYSQAKHGCLQCLPIYLSYVTAYESYFPGSVHDIILINTPSIFEVVLRITKPLLQERTRNMLHIFGTNRKQWETYLLEKIDANQLEPQFGGSKVYP